MDQQPPEKDLPPRPEPPLPTDCCGSGCTPCVYDLYEAQLEAWRRRVQEIQDQEGIE